MAQRRVECIAKVRVVFYVSLLILLLFAAADAAVIASPTCERDSVQAAITAAHDGDTVLIPAGTCTWTRTVVAAGKILTLQGAGADKTIIVHAVDPLDATRSSASYLSHALAFSPKAGGLSRITGITFKGGGVRDPYTKGIVNVSGASHQLRIHHCKFIPNGTPALVFHGYVWGVVDHNTFDISASIGYASYVHHDNWNGGSYGDGSWADDNSFGTERAIFFEDNTFTNNQTATKVYTAHDGWTGSRVVYRRNTYVNTYIGNHGTESGGRWRGQRQFEVYANTFSLNGSIAWPNFVGSRGGVGVVFNNTGVTTNGATITRFVAVSVFRARTAYSPWGKCDGSSVWDGNTVGGWPCLDQPGRGKSNLIGGTNPTPLGWPNQVADPMYAWNNTINGAVSGILPNDSVLVESRDFFNSARPGYAPYIYPHPLVSPQSTATATAPTNLQVR